MCKGDKQREWRGGKLVEAAPVADGGDGTVKEEGEGGRGEKGGPSCFKLSSHPPHGWANVLRGA